MEVELAKSKVARRANAHTAASTVSRTARLAHLASKEMVLEGRRLQ